MGTLQKRILSFGLVALVIAAGVTALALTGHGGAPANSGAAAAANGPKLNANHITVLATGDVWGEVEPCG
jgi:hypothetical protein